MSATARARVEPVGEVPVLIARVIAEQALSETGSLPNPPNPADTLDARLDAASQALSQAGLPLAHAQMLETGGDMLQLELAGDDLATLRRVLHAHFDPADVLIARDEIRVPDLFVSDMDSTMIAQECIDELADYAGLKDRIAAITERAMRGEIAFEQALRERVRLLKGLDETAIERCLAERIVPSVGARTLAATLKHRGCHTVLVTGGFHHFADAVAGWLGFEQVVANRLAVTDGKLTGELISPISDAAAKERVLRQEADRLGAGTLVMAAGDGANDVPMLSAATYGIAYRAKPVAREAATGWIDHGDLTSILKLLEIPRHEWVAG